MPHPVSRTLVLARQLVKELEQAERWANDLTKGTQENLHLRDSRTIVQHLEKDLSSMTY